MLATKGLEKKMAGRIAWVHTLYCTLLALWLGTFVAVGALAVPTVFATLPSPLGTDTAIVLFRLQGLIGFVVLAFLAVFLLLSPLRVLTLENKLLAALLVLGALLHFWIIPEMLAQRYTPNIADRSPLWHAASTALFLLQIAALLWVFIQRVRTPTLALLAAPLLAPDSKANPEPDTALEVSAPAAVVASSVPSVLPVDLPEIELNSTVATADSEPVLHTEVLIESRTVDTEQLEPSTSPALDETPSSIEPLGATAVNQTNTVL